MILPFKTQINGKPTHFVGKIYQSFKSIESLDSFTLHILSNLAEKCEKKGLFPFCGHNFETCLRDTIPKIHTIREDKHDRWKVGNKIHFTINNRTKNSFRFAPVLQVKSVQEIYIHWVPDYLEIRIDGRKLDHQEKPN